MRTMLAACLAMFLSFPAVAQECVTKEMHLAEMAKQYPDAINTDLSGEHEQIFLAKLSQQSGQDLMAFDAMIHRHPGVGSTLIVLFLEGCGTLKAVLPNNVVTELLGGPEA